MHEQQVRARRLLGHGGLRGAQGAHPAPARRAGNGDAAESTPPPFRVGLPLTLTLVFIPNGSG